MSSYDILSIINQMAAHITKLQEKVKSLEKANKQLTEQIESIEKQPPVTVERIDYHFDQLKIERLEGTLNIGINPQDLQNMDEFGIGLPPNIPNTPNQISTEEKMRLQDAIFQYVDEEVPIIVEDTKKQLGLRLDDSYTHFIQNDIQKQLPNRLEYYLNKLLNEKRHLPFDEIEKQIIQLLKADIEKAVHSFFSQFPMKGGEQNDI